MIVMEAHSEALLRRTLRLRSGQACEGAVTTWHRNLTQATNLICGSN